MYTTNESIRYALKIHAFIEKSFIMLSSNPFAIFPGSTEQLPITFDNIYTSGISIYANSYENKQRFFVLHSFCVTKFYLKIFGKNYYLIWDRKVTIIISTKNNAVRIQFGFRF